MKNYDIKEIAAGLPKKKKAAAKSNTLTNKTKHFCLAFDNLLEGIQVHDFNWRYIYVNKALVNYSGYKKAELLGHTIMEKYPGVEQTPLFKAMQRCMANRTAEQLETEFVFPDGNKIDFEISIQPIKEGISVLSVDRTAQKKALRKLLKASHLYAFISQVNQHIVRINDEASLFQNACDFAVNFGKFKMAWIGLYDYAQQTVALAYQSGIPAKYLSIFNVQPLTMAGPQQYVVDTDGYYVNNDILYALDLSQWKDIATEQQIQSCIVVPIKKAGKIIGSLNLYATELNFFDKEEIALVKEVTGDISFALNLFEKTRQHKQAEEQIILNENRFRAIIDKGTDMVTMRTAQGELTYISPSITHTMGYEVEEILGAEAYLHVHPDDLPRITQQANELLKRPGGSYFREQRLKHKNGNWIWCEGTVTNLLNEPGVNALVANFRDVSAKKAIEQQLSFDRNNLEALINNTTDVMWSIDRDFKLISFNLPLQEILKMMGGKAIEKGDNMLDKAFSKEQAAIFKKRYERTFAGETFTEMEYTENPEQSWSEISYNPIRLGHEIVGAACHSRDVTKTKKADEQIRVLNGSLIAANHQLSTILNTLPANIALLDKTGTIIEINEAWKQYATENNMPNPMHGLGDNYIAVCNAATNADKDNADDMATGTKKVLQGKLDEFALEYPCHSPSEERWFRVEVRPLTETKNSGVVVMHINITERKKAESEIMEMNNTLETRVEERTRALMDANTSLEAFSYSVSHDLRAPVRSVMGFAKIIKKEYGDTMNEDLKDLFSHIENSSLRMNAIINDLLTLAKSGVGTLNFKQVNLTDLFNSTWDNLLFAAPHNATLTLAELPFVYADGSMLQQVIVNLLSNAIKYSGKKEHPQVQVGFTETAEAVTIWVKDNGAGFDMKFYSVLFGAFQRLHGVAEFEGTGIGLTLVKRIIHRHGGEVWAEGIVNEGATFYFSLPKVMAPQVAKN